MILDLFLNQTLNKTPSSGLSFPCVMFHLTVYICIFLQSRNKNFCQISKIPF